MRQDRNRQNESQPESLHFVWKEMGDGYQTGLFDCCSDMSICCFEIWCGCLMVPNAMYWAESREEECHICHCCMPVCPVWTRANIRKLNKVSGQDYVMDSCRYCCCWECATCQDGRQLKILHSGAGPVQPLVAAPTTIVNVNVSGGSGPSSMNQGPPYGQPMAPGYGPGSGYGGSYSQTPPQPY
jgi:Cys-rich protein (TIGR01571 family)